MSNPHAEHTQNIRNWKIAQLEGGGRGVRLACVSEQKQRLRKRDGQIEEEKGTGYFSTSFRGPSPQHRRKIVREVREKSSLSPYLSLHSLPEIWLSWRFASGWIDALSCRRRHVRIRRDARIEVGWLHRSAGISLFLRNMLDTRIYLGGRNGRCTRLQELLRGAARGWLTTAHRLDRRKSNGGNRHCRKKAQQGNGHKSKHLPGPSFGRQCMRPPVAFVW